jgi:hypothetical protein
MYLLLVYVQIKQNVLIHNKYEVCQPQCNNNAKFCPRVPTSYDLRDVPTSYDLRDVPTSYDLRDVPTSYDLNLSS